MSRFSDQASRHPSNSPSTLMGLALLLCCSLASGCASLTNPALQGIPVRLLPEEFKAKSVEGLKTIPLSMLGLPKPNHYLIGPEDVLGIYVEGVLGERGGSPPILPPVRLENLELPQATGFPIQVRLDGTISLPLLEPIKVSGMTFAEAEAAISRAYVKKQILRPGRERITVSLARPRLYHILVLREDSPNPNQAIISTTQAYGSPEFIGISRKGTGWELILPAYHNDVVTALAKSGGLPGTDALDLVVVQRNVGTLRNWDTVMQEYKTNGVPSAIPGCPIVEIPLRLRPGTPLPIKPTDVTLGDGDVVYIPARDERLFYTGGQLPPGQHILPRDHDLDVLEALARVRGPLFNGNFAVSNFTGTNVQPGLGQPSPTLLTIIRKVPCGGQILIRVNLNKAVCDPRERLLIQAGDFLIQQETPEEATVRYFTQVFNINWIFKPYQSNWGLGTAVLSTPGGNAPATISPVGVGIAAPTPTFGGTSSAANTIAPIGIGTTTPVSPFTGGR